MIRRMKHLFVASLPLLLFAAACGPYTTDSQRAAPAGAAFAAAAPCQPTATATATVTEPPPDATATNQDGATELSAQETTTPVEPAASPTSVAPDVSPTVCPTREPTATAEATSTPSPIPAVTRTAPEPTPPSPPQLTATPTATPGNVPTTEGTSVAITATARAGSSSIAYLSIGDGIQWGCCGPLEASSASIFRAYLERRIGRPVIWQTSGSGYQTTDTFISNGGIEPQLDIAIRLINQYRDEGVPLAAITMSIGGNNLVDIGRACASPPCLGEFVAGIAHLREQLDVIYSRIVAAKDEHTPLLVLLYYDSSECNHNPYSGPAVDAWNAVIAEVAGRYGAYLVDARSLFRGHCDWIDGNGLDASAKGHAALAAEYQRVYESLPPALRLP